MLNNGNIWLGTSSHGAVELLVHRFLPRRVQRQVQMVHSASI